MSKLLIVAAVLALSGCHTVVKPFDPPAELLALCEATPPLDGLDGKSVVLWAEQAGPGIVACRTNHNALVSIIKAQKTK